MNRKKLIIIFYCMMSLNGVMGIGDCGLGIGDWAQSPIPNPQSPIHNPQSPTKIVILIFIFIKLKHFKLNK